MRVAEFSITQNVSDFHAQTRAAHCGDHFAFRLELIAKGCGFEKVFLATQELVDLRVLFPFFFLVFWEAFLVAFLLCRTLTKSFPLRLSRGFRVPFECCSSGCIISQ